MVAFDANYDHRAIDTEHALLLLGTVASAKPKRLLMLGIGTGFAARAILDTLLYNEGDGCNWLPEGRMTIMDNWLDFDGKEPEAMTRIFRDRGVQIVTSHEREFCFAAPESEYDFLVSDADHGGGWVEQHFRLTRPGAPCFFHDTNNPDYANLYQIKTYVQDRHWSFFHFTENSRPEDRCHRGFLMVKNGK